MKDRRGRGRWRGWREWKIDGVIDGYDVGVGILPAR
jgi:hypothetical protein